MKQMDQSGFNAERAFQLVQEQLATMQQLLQTHEQTLSSHTGTLAEILTIVKRLDEERLVEHHRLNKVVEDVKQLEHRYA